MNSPRTILIDLKDWLIRAATGKRHLPPARLRDVGGGDFEAIGQEFLGYFVELANLQPDARVLEIGCGIGRMAIPLTQYLLTDGSYTGMDVVGESIRWCQRHITKKHPNFRFYHTDLFNKRYNPEGTAYDWDYQFSLPDEAFNFIFLTSVFTHMLPEGVENYLHEMRRMLANDGQVFITLFLLNDVQQTLAQAGKNVIDFRYGNDVYQTLDAAVPESAVAYNEAYLWDLIDRCGFKINEPVLYGNWSGREDGLSGQDIVIITKSRP